MGEEKQPGDANSNGGTPPAETPPEATPANGEQPKGEEGKPEGDGKTPEKTGDGQGTEKKDGDGTPPPTKTEPPKSQEEDEPPTRKTKLDFILERKQKKLEKLKEEKLHKVNDELKEHGDDDDDDGISPDDEKLVEKVVERKYGKYFSRDEERDAKAEVKEFLNTDPQGKYFKKYEDKILKWSRHPNRANVPLRTIALELAGNDLLKIGAELEREAQKKADESKAGGGSARATEGGKKDWSNATPAEVEAEIERVKRENS
jgi:hypothetical protein